MWVKRTVREREEAKRNDAGEEADGVSGSKGFDSAPNSGIYGWVAEGAVAAEVESERRINGPGDPHPVSTREAHPIPRPMALSGYWKLKVRDMESGDSLTLATLGEINAFRRAAGNRGCKVVTKKLIPDGWRCWLVAESDWEDD